MLLTLRFCGLRANELVILSTAEVDLDAFPSSTGPQTSRSPYSPRSDRSTSRLPGRRAAEAPGIRVLLRQPEGNRSLRGRYGPRALYGLMLEARTAAGVTGRPLPHRGVTPTPRASCAVAWTLASFSACQATPTSRQPRHTCISQPPTSSPPSTGRSQKAESWHCSVTFWFTHA